MQRPEVRVIHCGSAGRCRSKSLEGMPIGGLESDARTLKTN